MTASRTRTSTALWCSVIDRLLFSFVLSAIVIAGLMFIVALNPALFGG